MKITKIISHVLQYDLPEELGYSQQYYARRSAHQEKLTALQAQRESLESGRRQLENLETSARTLEQNHGDGGVR